MDCSPPGSSVHGFFQARILEWVAISFSTDLSLKNKTPKALMPGQLLQRTVPQCHKCRCSHFPAVLCFFQLACSNQDPIAILLVTCFNLEHSHHASCFPLLLFFNLRNQIIYPVEFQIIYPVEFLPGEVLKVCSNAKAEDSTQVPRCAESGCSILTRLAGSPSVILFVENSHIPRCVPSYRLEYIRLLKELDQAGTRVALTQGGPLRATS